MIHIANSQAAFDTIAKTLPVSVGYDAKRNERGERLVWLAMTRWGDPRSRRELRPRGGLT
jgi:hypothetical protein